MTLGAPPLRRACLRWPLPAIPGRAARDISIRRPLSHSSPSLITSIGMSSIRRSTPRSIALGVLAAIVALLYAATLTVFIPAVGTDAALGDTTDAVFLIVVPVVLFPLAACGVGLIVYLCTHRDVFRAVLALLLLGLALELVACYWAGVGSAV